MNFLIILLPLCFTVSYKPKALTRHEWWTVYLVNPYYYPSVRRCFLERNRVSIHISVIIETPFGWNTFVRPALRLYSGIPTKHSDSLWISTEQHNLYCTSGPLHQVITSGLTDHAVCQTTMTSLYGLLNTLSVSVSFGVTAKLLF